MARIVLTTISTIYQLCHIDDWFFTGKIYVTGGQIYETYLISAEMYDTETDQWTFISPMLSVRRGHSCIAFDGSMYVIGKYLRLFE
jgi:hypothetical protein